MCVGFGIWRRWRPDKLCICELTERKATFATTSQADSTERPSIRAPLLDLRVYDSHAIDTGYLFLAPWATIYQELHPTNYPEAFQTGPHIYDFAGVRRCPWSSILRNNLLTLSQNLVWSGALAFGNKNFADFRPFQYDNGDFKLTGIEIGFEVLRNTSYGDGITRGKGHVLDNSYQKEHAIFAPPAIDSFNMHELRVVDGGRSALHIIWRPEYIDVTELGLSGSRAGWVGNMGFREVAIATGETLFEWWSLAHVPLSESSWITDDLRGPSPTAWDYFHATSVDKGPDGNFLVSSRHTNCVYKVSATDGKIMWRLGGNNSSFAGDVSFARQHDVYFFSAADIQMEPKDGIEYISLFNNAADEHSNSLSRPSSALVIRLDLNDMTAGLVRQIERPDKGTSLISGNAHILANGNHFVNWDTTGFISEHSPEGKLLLQGSFASDRFSNYRTYKGVWKAYPPETEIALACFVHGTTVLKSTTTCHVSWNGATEVWKWKFFGVGSDGSSQVGEVAKTGFETIAQWEEFHSTVRAEAVDLNGSTLGTSLSVSVRQPKHWQ